MRSSIPPAALCAWIIEKFWAWTDSRDVLEDVLIRDELLDNLMLYWLPATGASSARLYWASMNRVNEWISGTALDTVDVPTGCSIFLASSSGPRVAGRRGGFPASATGTSLTREVTSLRSSSPTYS
jgi:hypothetical protein